MRLTWTPEKKRRNLTRKLVLLLVAYVERLEGEEEVIHIISARKASKYETKIYETAASKA